LSVEDEAVARRSVPMSPFDLTHAVAIEHADEFDEWFRARDGDQREVVVAILNRRNGRQTVTLVELQEVALNHGWVDTQTRRIDDLRYAIRFVPRRPNSVWGPKNRAMAERMIAAGRVTPAGFAALPVDLRSRTE